jgi:hypothetical protein
MRSLSDLTLDTLTNIARNLGYQREDKKKPFPRRKKPYMEYLEAYQLLHNLSVDDVINI